MQIAQTMRSSVMAPGELAPLQTLYAIETGHVLYLGRVLGAGKTWGGECIVLTDGLLKFARTDRARSMTYLECRGLSRSDLRTVLESHPAAQAWAKKVAIFVALKRFVIQAARDARLAERKRGGGASMGPNADMFVLMDAAVNDEAHKGADNLQAAEGLSAINSLGSRPETPGVRSEATGQVMEEMNLKLVALTEAVEARDRQMNRELTGLAEAVHGVAGAIADVQRELRRRRQLSSMHTRRDKLPGPSNTDAATVQALNADQIRPRAARLPTALSGGEGTSTARFGGYIGSFTRGRSFSFGRQMGEQQGSRRQPTSTSASTAECVAQAISEQNRESRQDGKRLVGTIPWG